MASIDKAAIVWSMAIVAVAIGITFASQGTQDDRVSASTISETITEEPVMRGIHFIDKLKDKKLNQIPMRSGDGTFDLGSGVDAGARFEISQSDMIRPLTTATKDVRVYG